MPDKIKACVLAGAGDSDVEVFLRAYAGASIVTYDEANLVVFTGGSDVTPSLYGERNVASGTDWLRDVNEQDIFQQLLAQKIPMVGICRGSQFLHVMMKGKLWQDVTDHCCQHDLIELATGFVIKDTCSTHHQMVRMAWVDGSTADDAGFELIAEPVSPIARSDYYVCAGGEHELVHYTQGEDIWEVEAYRYAKAGVLGIQGHPEWGGEEFAKWGGLKVMQHFDTFYQRNIIVPARANMYTVDDIQQQQGA